MTNEQLAKRLARGIFKAGDEPGHKTHRIAFKSRCCRHGCEQEQGGLCEVAMESVILSLLDSFGRKDSRSVP